MKNKVDLLEERLIALNNILGDMDASELNAKSTTKIIITKDKLKNISDVIIRLKEEISENDSITFKEIYKKCI
jgi:hypothetical protein